MTTTPYLDKWLQENDATDDDEENEYTKNKEWWEPYVIFDEDDDEKRCYWTCDHLRDAQGVMEQLWNEILGLRQIIDERGKK